MSNFSHCSTLYAQQINLKRIVTLANKALKFDKTLDRDAAFIQASEHVMAEAVSEQAKHIAAINAAYENSPWYKAPEAVNDAEQRAPHKYEAHKQAVKSINRANEKLARNQPGTVAHENRVAASVAILAKRLKLDKDAAIVAVLAARSHDVGKTGMHDIINKPEALTDAEFEKVKRHPEFTERILRKLGLPEEVIKAAREHHMQAKEGKGYPAHEGTSGYISQILQVADIGDSLIGGIGSGHTKPTIVWFANGEKQSGPRTLTNVIKAMDTMRDSGEINADIYSVYKQMLLSNTIPAAQKAQLKNAQKEEDTKVKREGDVRGLSFAVVKNGNIITSGGIPSGMEENAESANISYYKKLTDRYKGELHLGKNPDLTLDNREPLIFGKTWSQIQAAQAKEAVPEIVKSTMPKDSVLVYTAPEAGMGSKAEIPLNKEPTADKETTDKNGTFISKMLDPVEKADKESRKKIREHAKEVTARTATNKQKLLADKLRSLAQSTLDAAQAKENQDRNTNTPKRAREAGYAITEALKQEALAKTMFNLADAHERGATKALAGVSNRAQVEMLNDQLRYAKDQHDKSKKLPYQELLEQRGRPATEEDVNFAKYPVAEIHEGNLPALKRKLSEVHGAKKLAGEIGNTLNHEQYNAIKKLLGEKEAEYSVGWYPVKQLKEQTRLKSLGITTEEELKAALNEFIRFKEGAKAEDAVAKAERELVGGKHGIDYFPTPKPLAKRMAELADIKPGDRVLEPSAGNGNLADAAKAEGAAVDTIEISDALRKVLLAKEYPVVAYDFNDFEPTGKYDAVIMNPPFSKGMDAEHIRKAYDMVKDGGKLVAIAGEGVFFRNDTKAVAFRDWLNSVNAEVEQLPAGTFLDKSLQSTTGANARLITISKAGEKGQFSKRSASDTNPKEAKNHLVEQFGPGINTLINNGTLNLTQGKEAWPEAAKKGDYQAAEAVYINGKAYIDLHATERSRLPAVLIHEIGEHYNLKRMVGTNNYEALQRQITKLAQVPGSVEAKTWNEVARTYKEETVGSERFVSEVIAKAGENNPNLVWYKRLLSQIKAFLMRHGFARGFITGTLTGKDMHALLVSSLQSAATGRVLNEPRFYHKSVMASFAGENSETADLFNLELAKQRIANGESKEQVRQDTGWVKSPDGKWRYEISDEDAKLTKNYRDFEGQPWGIDKTLDHPKLFAAYPELKNTLLFLSINKDYTGKKGSYNAKTNTITIDARSEQDAVNTLLHEIQHNIQAIEGFSEGGNARMITESLFAESYKHELEDLKKQVDEAIPTGNREKIDTLYEKIVKLHTPAQFDAYKRLSGEVEARNTQLRQALTDAERRVFSPESTQDTLSKDQIITWNGKVMESRTEATKEASENRIKDLFAGATPEKDRGVKILDKSDVLDMLGKGDKNLLLAEAHALVRGFTEHTGFSEENWNKAPEWLDNPTAVFKQQDGDYRFIGPDLVDGNPVVMAVVPNTQSEKDRNEKVAVLKTAFAKDDSAKRMQVQRWLDNGDLVYVDLAKTPAFNAATGYKLPVRLNDLKVIKQKLAFKNKELTKQKRTLLENPDVKMEADLSAYKAVEAKKNPTPAGTVDTIRSTSATDKQGSNKQDVNATIQENNNGVKPNTATPEAAQDAYQAEVAKIQDYVDRNFIALVDKMKADGFITVEC